MWVILLLAVWELTVKLGKISPLILPGIEDVVSALVRDTAEGRLVPQTFFSLAMIAGGMLVSFVHAVFFSFIARLHEIFEALADVLCMIAHPLPGLALMPLIILWFGTGSSAVFVIIIHSALWPLLLNLKTGLERTPEIYTDVGKNLSMSSAAIHFEIRFRYAVPYLIAGLKIAWARSWRAFIGAEMVFGAVGAYGGLGSYILARRTFMDTAGLFAGIVIVVVIGILVESALFRLIENRTVRRWGMRQ
ncbi:MAG: ABC transporter permease subunit [Lachnospiraceae bacterium]|nr:ABC transporter permease subunit [Lachnospiraceae bacterium]